MAKATQPKPAAKDRRDEDGDPRPDPPLEGEVMDHVEGALVAISQRDVGDTSSALAVAISKAALNEQITTAKTYPRAVQALVDNIVTIATLNQATAESCQYGLPRGWEDDPVTGKKKRKIITGPSVRLMEIVANQWGNNDYGVESVDVDKDAKVVRAVAYHHDLETNSKIRAQVSRRITDSRGRLLNDDMITVTSNAAASIALRNAIQKGIPAPIWGIPYGRVQEVIRGDVKSLGARRVDLLEGFHKHLNVAPAMVFELLGVKGELDIGLDELVAARSFYAALRNNEVTLDDLLNQVKAPGAPKGLGDAFGRQAASAGTPAHDPVTGEIKEGDKPKPTVEATKDGDVIQDGPAPADVAYFHAGFSALDPEGRRVTFKNGERFSSAKPSANVPIYRDHAPEKAAPAEEGSAKTGESTTASTSPPSSDASPGQTEPETEPSTTTTPDSPPASDGAETESTTANGPTWPDEAQDDEDLGAAFDQDEAAEDEVVEEEPEVEEDQTPAEFAAFAEQVKTLTSWADVKKALGDLRKTEIYKSKDTPGEMKRAVRIIARNRVEDLRAQGAEAVDPKHDPEYFSLWLDDARPHEVQPVWSSIVRDKAYQALPDGTKDALADAAQRRMQAPA